MGYRKISDDLKMCSVRLRRRGRDSIDEISRLTKISRRTLMRTWKRQRDKGTVAKDEAIGVGRPRSYAFKDAQYLLSCARYNPSTFLDEYSRRLKAHRHLSVHLSTIHYMFKRSGLSVKRVQKMAKERDPLKRAEYIRRIGKYTALQLVFADEASKNDRTYARLWGRAPIGERVETYEPFVWGKRLSLLAAMALDKGIIAGRVVEGSFTKELFLDFLRNDLLPTMHPYPHPRSVVIVDNARIHKSVEVQALVHSYGCRIEYLPPYSPDFNPIEQAFSVIKAHLRRHGRFRYPSEQMIFELYNACSVIQPEMTWGFFRHAGYL